MNAWTKYHFNPSDSCQNISLKTKNVNLRFRENEGMKYFTGYVKFVQTLLMVLHEKSG